MSDHDDFIAISPHSFDFLVHFGDERARSVGDIQVSVFGCLSSGGRYAVGTEDKSAISGGVAGFLDEDSPLLLEAVYHMPIVNDLVAYIDRFIDLLYSAFDNLNGSINARAKTTRIGKKYFHWFPKRSETK